MTLYNCDGSISIFLHPEDVFDRDMLNYINLKIRHETENALIDEDFDRATDMIRFQREIKDGLTDVNDQTAENESTKESTERITENE